MKTIGIFLALAAIFVVACGVGGDDDGDSATTTTTTSVTASSTSAASAAAEPTTATTTSRSTSSRATSSSAATSSGPATGATGGGATAANADRIAHMALPALEDLPGGARQWQITAEDELDDSDNDFLTLIQGNPECETLENLATLESVFGGEDEDDDEPLAEAQREFQHQDPNALIPTMVEVKIELDETASGSRAEFALVKDLFESEQTSNCLISVLNKQFTQTMPAGVAIEVAKGTGSAQAPQNGAQMAFDMKMTVAGLDVPFAMQMYFWPYKKADVQVLFMGTNDTLTRQLVGGMLSLVDKKVQAALDR